MREAWQGAIYDWFNGDGIAVLDRTVVDRSIELRWEEIIKKNTVLAVFCKIELEMTRRS